MLVHLSKIKYFDRNGLSKIAAEHITKFKQRVTQRGLDKDDQPFPKYSDSYMDFLLSNGKTNGKRKANVKGLPLTVNPTKIARRLFFLRGLTMRNFRVRGVSTDNYTLGWDGEAAGIVEANAGRRVKRDIIGVPDSEMNWVLSRLGKLIDKEFAKIKSKTIKVG